MSAPTDAELVAQIRRGATRLARRLRLERPTDGQLSLGKLAVLGHLRRWGAATPGELASAERLQPQSLTRVIAELAAQDLITRHRDERDRRQYVLEITPAGRLALVEDMDGRDAWLAQAMEGGGLTETERQVLYLAGALMDRLSGLGRSPHQVRGATDERGAEGEHPGLGEQQDQQPE